jgi:hypothetical protein
MSSWTNAQVVDAVIAEMKWSDQLITAFRKISGPPNGARIADWDLQDALDWMESDLGDEKETRRAAEYMVGALKRIASQGAASAATGGTGVAVGSGITASIAAAGGGGGDPPGSVSVPDSVPDSGAVGATPDAHVFTGTSAALFEAKLPTVIDVHFADLSTPLIASSLDTPPQSFAEVPLFLSRFFSENSRWLAMKNTAAAAIADPDCPRWEWPSDQPPTTQYSDGGDCVNMAAYVKLALPIALPLLQDSHLALQWARFLRCALYFSYATSAPHQRVKRAVLLQVSAHFVYIHQPTTWLIYVTATL